MSKINEFFIKIIHLFDFLRSFYFYLFKIKIKIVPEPTSNIIEIGSIDDNLLIHVADQYKKYFNGSGLYTEGDYVNYKTGIIILVLYEEKVLIKKAYKGTLKDRLKFYNEIRCLSRLSDLKNIPDLIFIDYKNLINYIEFIEGENLQSIFGSAKNYSKATSKKVRECCKNVLNNIHKNNIAVLDIQGHNIIYNPTAEDVFIVDFADSIYYGAYPRKFTEYLQKRDKRMLESEVLNKL